MIYDLFALLAMIGGIYSGTYFFRYLPAAYKRDKLLFLFVSIYIVSTFWLAGVYLVTLFDLIPTPALTIGVFTRPATMTMLWIPPLIMQRVGL
jgi:hypothetical protein